MTTNETQTSAEASNALLAFLERHGVEVKSVEVRTMDES